MSRSLRVTVRGVFDNLSEAQLAELVAERDEHDFLHTAYTADGYLAYDLPARPFFTFRFADSVGEQAEIPAARARAEAKAAAWMAGRGFPVRELSSQAVDMSVVPLGKRGRREADKSVARPPVS
ncbi:hypothetical protein GCM10010172_05690 [Paractinoplanes ferrugineus]|uniref:Uncharacterized protein n=1 Tax=Paractinoplanes ferrugineus TaxID=113564 RepID=A0A919MFA0_9ACTN|nr:DUF6204 family protein [Actinoplanes ferrugineus]GIE12514.1 hypothetical protein Afe05nite_43540 [Actinoplanes ferrugineus]